MWNKVAVVLLCIVNIIFGCSTITLNLSSNLTGEGYHRTVRVSAEISSMQRLTECNLAYFYQIPKGIYILSESLNETLFNHCSLSSEWNLEDLSDSIAVTNLKPLIFYSTKEQRKVFVFKDEFKFTVHFRYNPPKRPDDPPPAVEIHPPRVYLRCKDNTTLLEDKSCYANRENLACGCNPTPKCSFIRLAPSNPIPTEVATVPSADKTKSRWVVTSTLFFISICLLIIFISRPDVESKE